MFFEGRGKEHQTLRRLVRILERAGIDDAIVVGMAVNAHRFERGALRDPGLWSTTLSA